MTIPGFAAAYKVSSHNLQKKVLHERLESRIVLLCIASPWHVVLLVVIVTVSPLTAHAACSVQSG
jgi:hypothetical protein